MSRQNASLYVKLGNGAKLNWTDMNANDSFTINKNNNKHMTVIVVVIVNEQILLHDITNHHRCLTILCRAVAPYKLYSTTKYAATSWSSNELIYCLKWAFQMS